MVEWQKRALSSMIIMAVLSMMIYAQTFMTAFTVQIIGLLLVAVLCALMAQEWSSFTASNQKKNNIKIFNALAMLACSVFMIIFVLLVKHTLGFAEIMLGGLALILMLFVIACFIAPKTVLPRMDASRETRIFRQMLLRGFGLLYLGMASASFYLLFLQPDGEFIALIIVLAVIWADTAAYIGGKRWGRRKLCPSISPGKTWFGAFFAFATLFVFYSLISLITQSQMGFSLFTILLIFSLIILSMIGDIFISLLKRNNSLKDTGRIIPGHGGILDRLDGHIFVFFCLFPLLVCGYSHHIGAALLR